MSPALSGLSAWAVVIVSIASLVFVYALVRLVLSKHHPRAGDEIVIRVFPPRIEIRYGGPGTRRRSSRLADSDRRSL
ncbi:hypothetical protein [Nocardia terpenica]|uniref:Uncharacterized protein n=1 Tax=Nocardia terpenica TaxID=455432 RepID=A0A6G9Z151_9NOCA|nr:hypothetical protein [Nocardia terpenica]QIS18733.1 hypothetical protein F6W96_10970 [Nocardia terpenica]